MAFPSILKRLSPGQVGQDWMCVAHAVTTPKMSRRGACERNAVWITKYMTLFKLSDCMILPCSGLQPSSGQLKVPIDMT